MDTRTVEERQAAYDAPKQKVRVLITLVFEGEVDGPSEGALERAAAEVGMYMGVGEDGYAGPMKVVEKHPKSRILVTNLNVFPDPVKTKRPKFTPRERVIREVTRWSGRTMTQLERAIGSNAKEMRIAAQQLLDEGTLKLDEKLKLVMGG